MKKFVSIITLIFIMGLSFAGCGKEEGKPVESEIPASSESSTSTVVDYKATVPNVGTAFVGGTITLVELTDSKYYVRVTGCDQTAYDAFIESCKAAGFDNVKTNMDYARGQHSFEAYTTDGSYKIGVYFYTDENSNPTYIDIICEYKLN